MRILPACVGLTLLAAACSGSSGGASGTGSTGGTTSGTTGGLLAVGSPCTENAACPSDVCGLDGTGNCCTSACSTSDATCGATACDSTGACAYPASGVSCGMASCRDGLASSTGTCDGSGTCSAGTPTACAGNFACQDATSCATTCTSSTGCATGFVCNTGACVIQVATGGCTENDDCMSDVCGTSGTGQCCRAACTSATAPCGAIGCDAITGACAYPDAGTACGTVLETCTTGTQQNPSVCDGTGNCDNSPGTTSCSPFICGANACLSSCTDSTSCGRDDFCDVANATCCSGLFTLGTIAVDSTKGSDATACCGIGGNGPCQTIHQAMKIIDSVQGQNMTISATVGGTGGDWAPANEVYPIVLGWGVELSAPGVFFTGVNGDPEIFDIKNYSTNDTVGYASLMGTAIGLNQVSIGMDSSGNQSNDASAIEVEAGNTLYIANATLNGSASKKTAAITVEAGGSLWLGEDQMGVDTGTVTIGNSGAKSATDGYNGIVCGTVQGLGCTISDSALPDGLSSLVIEGQEGVDIDAEDNAVITLTSFPIVGLFPSAAGFKSCPNKPDSSSAQTEAILLNGSAQMTFSNGTVQCISGGGFVLQAADNLKSVPTLSLDSTTIQNTEVALHATAGSATIKNSTIQYNYNGVEQGSDQMNTATVDLSGGGVGTSTVVCSNSIESFHGMGGTPGVSVLNTTASSLDADDVDWDTNNNPSAPPDDPDLFSCNAALTTCTCENSDMSCTSAGGVDGMDAVYTSTGLITQTGAGLSNADCSTSMTGQKCGNGQPCPKGDCCNGLTFMCQVGQICPG